MEIEKITNNQIQVEADSLSGRANHLLEWVERLEVKDFKEVQVAQELLKEAQRLEREMENKKSELKRDLLERCRFIDNVFKEAVGPAIDAKKQIKDKILGFNNRLLEAKLKIQSNIENQVKGSSLDLLKEEVKIKGIREVTDFEIVDESLIPREYLLPDLVKIKRDSKLGVVIKGIKLFKKTTVQ